MASLPPELRRLIESGPLAHLSTTNADGSPQVSVIWIGIDGEHLVTAHMREQLKLRNIQRDPRVVLSLEGPREPGVFLAPHAVVRAQAAIEGPSEDAWELLDRLAKVYVAPGRRPSRPREARAGSSATASSASAASGPGRKAEAGAQAWDNRDVMSIETAEEQAAMERVGALVASVLAELRAAVAPGITTGALDDAGRAAPSAARERRRARRSWSASRPRSASPSTRRSSTASRARACCARAIW